MPPLHEGTSCCHGFPCPPSPSHIHTLRVEKGETSDVFLHILYIRWGVNFVDKGDGGRLRLLNSRRHEEFKRMNLLIPPRQVLSLTDIQTSSLSSVPCVQECDPRPQKCTLIQVHMYVRRVGGTGPDSRGPGAVLHFVLICHPISFSWHQQEVGFIVPVFQKC